MPFISKDIPLTTVQIGVGAAIMLLFYGPAQLVTGWVCDRIGSRRVMIFSILAWSVLTWWQGDVRSVDQWYLRMALFGIMIGTEFVPSTRLVVRYFPTLQRARAQSVLSWAWIVTPAWGPILATAMYAALGDQWRPVFHILAVAGLVPFILILIFIHDRPENNHFVKKTEALESYSEEIDQGVVKADDVLAGNTLAVAAQSKSLSISMTQILKTPGYVPLIFVYIATQLAYWGVMTWSANYLTAVHKFSVTAMGAWASVYFIGGMVGSFLAGWISDHVLHGRRKPMIVVCFAAMIPFIVLLATLQIGVAHSVLLLTLTGAGFFANMAWGPAISLPADMFPVEAYGKAMGFVNCFAYMASAASPYIMGRLISVDANGVSHYFWAWIWVAFTALIGVVAGLLLHEKKKAPAQLPTVAVAA